MLTVTGSAGAYVLSIDGGTTTVTVNGTETNAAVVHGTTGEILYVDATGITGTGSEPIRVPGTYDMFNILICARDMLRNVDGLSDSQWRAMMDATIGSLDVVQEKLVRSFPIVGGRIGTLSNLQASLEDMKMNTDEEISRKQDADITQVAVDLARYEVMYEMSLSVAAKMFSLSLMDFPPIRASTGGRLTVTWPLATLTGTACPSIFPTTTPDRVRRHVPPPSPAVRVMVANVPVLATVCPGVVMAPATAVMVPVTLSIVPWLK